VVPGGPKPDPRQNSVFLWLREGPTSLLSSPWRGWSKTLYARGDRQWFSRTKKKNSGVKEKKQRIKGASSIIEKKLAWVCRYRCRRKDWVVSGDFCSSDGKSPGAPLRVKGEKGNLGST